MNSVLGEFLLGPKDSNIHVHGLAVNSLGNLPNGRKLSLEYPDHSFTCF